ncbi:MAG: ABC transporter permease [Candidatus Cloacimonadota bacterium]|jgi:ABC-2 type transport system permease protein|nr:ABC transporter permease [Candidatus Cloacimonadota bacterium]OQC72107.1 MAG: ABC-2 family transporter protein [Candidatus Cloacimonetes bacterium ADurb.Bin003]HOE54749.1 ABC transporter permease [Candidatus Cloacimonas acidaminovorans]HRS60376.1 ABC transporter permease [Candidatus Cloacimonas sp.]HOS06953.1 ABC transporter permease [Candidatus Cloacimonas acidaminovorans]
MKTVFTIAKKEYELALHSISTYIVYILFLVIIGIIFSNMVFKIARAELRFLFEVIHIVFLFYIPAITMGSIAKERQTGTLELLSTLPIKLSSIVWGKILSALFQIITIIILSLVFFGIIVIFGEGIDYGAIICGYIGLILAGLAYASIGVFASSFPSNQILAFVLALLISAVFYLLKFLLPLLPFGLVPIVQYFSFDYHLSSFLKGVIDTRDILFFLAVTVIFALLAQFNLQSKNLMQEK